MASWSSSKVSSHMYSNSGDVTLLQSAPKAWLLWAVASPLPLWLVLWRETNRKKKDYIYIYLYIYIYIYIEIRNKQVTPAKDLLGYHKRPPVKWNPLTSPYIRGTSTVDLQ